MITPIYMIYKASGDDAHDTDTSNYRGITLLSCLAKFFSNLINHRPCRLTLFVDKNNIIGPEQAGFRAGFSTTDHMFAIKTLIDIYNHKPKKTILLLCRLQQSF